MNQNEAKRTLLVRAVELADPTGMVLPHAVRERCTNEARPPGSGGRQPGDSQARLTRDEEAFLARRAALIDAELGRRDAELASLVDAPELRWWLGAALLGLAFGAGLLSYGVAQDKRLNLLAFPLLGLILWNLGVYVVLLARRLGSGPAGRGPGLLSTALAQRLARIRLSRPPAPGGAAATRPAEAVAAKAAATFLRDWLPLSSPLALARVRQLLHAGAALVALGAVSGLVLRGVYLEYLAGWESTFLGADAVRAILATILAPAAVLTGVSIPEGAAFEALRFRPGFDGENARRWISLYVVAVCLYVVVPRMLLMFASAARSRRLRRDFYHPTGGDGYFHRLLQAQRGGGEVAAILWHGVAPTPTLRARVRDAMHDALGGRVTLEFLDPVEYGEEGSILEKLSAHGPRERIVTVFSLAATPEEEVHGTLLRLLASYGPPGEEQPPLVVLDTAPLERFAADPGFRAHHEDRLRTWERFLASHRATRLVLDPPGNAGPAGRSTA